MTPVVVVVLVPAGVLLLLAAVSGLLPEAVDGHLHRRGLRLTERGAVVLLGVLVVLGLAALVPYLLRPAS